MLYKLVIRLCIVLLSAVTTLLPTVVEAKSNSQVQWLDGTWRGEISGRGGETVHVILIDSGIHGVISATLEPPTNAEFETQIKLHQRSFLGELNTMQFLTDYYPFIPITVRDDGADVELCTFNGNLGSISVTMSPDHRTMRGYWYSGMGQTFNLVLRRAQAGAPPVRPAVSMKDSAEIVGVWAGRMPKWASQPQRFYLNFARTTAGGIACEFSSPDQSPILLPAKVRFTNPVVDVEILGVNISIHAVVSKDDLSMNGQLTYRNQQSNPRENNAITLSRS